MKNDQNNPTETQTPSAPEISNNDSPQNALAQPYAQPAGMLNKNARKAKLKMLLIPVVILVAFLGGYFIYNALDQSNTDVTGDNKYDQSPATNEQLAIDAVSEFKPVANDYQLKIELGDGRNEYSISFDDSGNTKVVSGDNVLIQTGGKTLIKLSGDDVEALDFMKNVLLLGEPDSKNLDNLQSKWIEIGTYLGATPALPNFTPPNEVDFSETLILETEDDDTSKDEETEVSDGKETQEDVEAEAEDESQNDANVSTDATISPTALYDLLAMIDGRIGYRIFTADISKSDLTEKQIDIELELNAENTLKSIETINFAGHTLRIQIELPSTEEIAAATTPIPLPEIVDYNFISNSVFSPDLQIAETEDDRERIADIKAMKTAFDIRLHISGEVSAYFGSDQEEFISEKMPGANKALFIDPAGKIIGINSGSYAYSGELDGGSKCGGTFYDIDKGDIEYPPCTKFFIVTTLDTGQDFQLNSGVY
ncbi:MAG: hypothetical protein ACI9T8_000673 [Candidatus Saccharimonadales bacterium]|jgi:hypothetical protein